MAAAAPTPPEAATPASSSGVADRAQRFRDATEQIRKRTELTAKAVGGLGLTVVSAVGIKKFTDVFPVPPPDQNWLWVGFLIFSFLVMVSIVGLFTYRLWHVSQPIVLQSDADRMDDLDAREKDIVRPLYAEMARLNRAPSLPAYEARAQRLYRIADRTESPRADELRQQADDIDADISSVEARAGMIVVRRRAGQAIRDWLAIVAFAAFAVAIVLFGLSADKLDSERTQLTKIVKDCADAEKAAQVGGVRALPPICRGSSATSGPAKTGPRGATGAKGTTGATGATGANGTATDRVRSATEAIRAAASLATLLASLEKGTSPAVAAKEGTKVLESFLHEVGYPLAKNGISKLAGTLWKRFARPHPPPLPPGAGQARPIKLTVVLRDRRSPLQLVQPPNIPPLFVFGSRQRYQTIKLTVVVRDRRPRVRIIRVPDD
jgi:hypothetical protein